MSSAELSLQSDIYAPSVNTEGAYTDYIPRIEKSGLRCPCTQRIYLRKTNFRTHIVTECHLIWLRNLNENRHNYYAENVRLYDLVKQQQKLLAEKEVLIVQKNALIAELSGQIFSNGKQGLVIDLLN